MASMASTKQPKKAYKFKRGDGSGVVSGPGGVTLELPGETDDPAMIEWLDAHDDIVSPQKKES